VEGLVEQSREVGFVAGNLLKGLLIREEALPALLLDALTSENSTSASFSE
jgi:hypothetical protein